MGGRTTRQRRAVLRLLTGCQDFVSAQELHAMLVAEAQPIGLTTVYRALRELEADGGVDVVRDEPGGRLYRRRPADGHRPYLICRCCGLSRAVESGVVEEWAGRIAADAGFAAVRHTVEFTGLCADCDTTADQQGEGPSCRWEPDHRGSRGRQARSCAN
ncbi:Fur family transcriptional regulator [Streptomyces sp. N50]|uniref:Fur family transcriptional regulator n=1 Tax=Streptomyces sp. N50 TaxID=3081765 RepID=UPI0029620242|nr:Fur family transcriptional regulator [Streptomyces sp. N50]WOX16063.1 Fur family transcriptional regulator [Streptomyces sp. N50]